jgi:proline iminopeptidase
MSAAFEDRRPPDATCRVAVEGGEVQVYVFGQGPNALLLLHGGPAVRCDHLQHTHARYADRGYKVVTFDQLGAGRSDRPDDPSLWNIERYCREVEAVRAQPGSVQICRSHSWGAMLAINFASHPERVKSLVIAHGIANMPFHQREVARLPGIRRRVLRMRVRREMNGDRRECRPRNS